MAPHLPERRTSQPPGRRVVAAILSPTGLAMGVGAGLIAGVAGLPWIGVVAVALGVVAARVMLALAAKVPPKSTVDPFAVGEPWRRFVTAALRHRRRFLETLNRLPDGPLRQRLVGVGVGVDEAVSTIWVDAQRGHQLTRARRDVTSGQAPEGDDTDPLLSSAGAERTSSLERLDNAIAETKQQLAVLDAQLGTVVTRAIEVVATATSSRTLVEPDDALVGMLDELEALRLALEALDERGDQGGATS